MAVPTFVYVGTYTGSKSKGIYLFRLQTENLEVSQNITLVPLGLAAETPNPSFIELDLKPAIQAKVSGVPVIDCHYGISNGRYALKVDQLLTNSNPGWLGDTNVH